MYNGGFAWSPSDPAKLGIDRTNTGGVKIGSYKKGQRDTCGNGQRA